MSAPTAGPSPATAPVEIDRLTRPRRRRWPWVLLAVVVVVLVVGGIVSEVAGRAFAADLVRDRIAGHLGIESMTDVDVEVGGRPLILQALSGKADEVRVTAGSATFGKVSGSLDLTVSGVSINRPQTIDRVAATFTVPNSANSEIKSYLEGDFDTVKLVGTNLEVSKEVTFLGLPLPFTEALSASAKGGELLFTPEVISVSGLDIRASDIRESIFAPVLTGFTETHNFCVNSQLPDGIGLTDADVSGSKLVLGLSGTDVSLGSDATGTCG